MKIDRCKDRCKRRWASFIGTLGLLLQTGMPLALTQVVMISPAMAQTAIQEGYRLMNQGLVNQAIAVFEQAVRDYPQSVQARLGLAMAYQRQGRIDDAFQAYNRVLEVDPNNRMALLSLGILGGYRIEWQERGIEALNQLLELNPNDLEARSQRALLYGYQGRFGAAIADYEIVLAANPTPEVILGAAQVYAYNGDRNNFV